MRARMFSEVNTYLITQPHDTPSRTDSHPSARHESLDTGFLRCVRERDLCELCLELGADCADNCVDAR
jgi:hypothetical protein